MARILCAVAACLLIGAAAQARPVSYEGGWTVIEETDRGSTSLLVHYTPNPSWSVGPKVEWARKDDRLFAGAQATYLAHRWFGEDYQANLYAFTGVGAAWGIDDNDADAQAAGFVGVMADWETRRWFVSYKARAFEAGDVGGGVMQAARLGWAPYEGDFGDLHTWLMVEVDHRPEAEEPVGVTPLLRFFKGPVLFEAGWSLTDDQPLATLQYRF